MWINCALCGDAFEVPDELVGDNSPLVVLCGLCIEEQEGEDLYFEEEEPDLEDSEDAYSFWEV